MQSTRHTLCVLFLLEEYQENYLISTKQQNNYCYSRDNNPEENDDDADETDEKV